MNHVVHYIPSTYLTYNWKFISLTTFIQFPLSIPQLIFTFKYYHGLKTCL